MIHAAGQDWITATEAPEHLGDDVNAAMVRAWAHDGKIKGYRVGRETYYPLADLTEIEYQTRTSQRGNRRTCAHAGISEVHF